MEHTTPDPSYQLLILTCHQHTKDTVNWRHIFGETIGYIGSRVTSEKALFYEG